MSRITRFNILRRAYSTIKSNRKLNSPPSGNDLARPCGIASMFRLPVQEDAQGLDACFVGVPIDWGASNRAGTRFGPRHIRVESTLVRAFNPDTGAMPYDSLNVADVGDLTVTPYDLERTCRQIEEGYARLISNGCVALAMGGDHTVTYPILRAIKVVNTTTVVKHSQHMSSLVPSRHRLLDDWTFLQGSWYKERHGPVGLIHVDAHMDIVDEMNGCRLAHGTTFRRAYEDGCLDASRVFQIGIRGSGYSVKDMRWPKSVGFNIIRCQHIYNQTLTPVMDKIRAVMGDRPVYISFDIDALDPSIAPGTGTPEIAGLNSMQALEIIRGARGLNIVGADLVEVSPPYDLSGNTSLTAANLLFEMLCVLPGVKYANME